MWPRRWLLAGVLALCGSGIVSARAPRTIEVVIAQIAYMPTETKATVGDVIQWTNKDIIPHTATAKNGAWKVVIPAHKTARLVLKKAGTFDYFCEFHPNMTARLVVAPKPSK